MTAPNPAQLEKEASDLYRSSRAVGELADKGGTGDWYSLSSAEKQQWRDKVKQIQKEAAGRYNQSRKQEFSVDDNNDKENNPDQDENLREGNSNNRKSNRRS